MAHPTERIGAVKMILCPFTVGILDFGYPHMRTIYIMARLFMTAQNYYNSYESCYLWLHPSAELLRKQSSPHTGTKVVHFSLKRFFLFWCLLLVHSTLVSDRNIETAA